MTELPLTCVARSLLLMVQHTPPQNFDYIAENLHWILPLTEALELEGGPFGLHTSYKVPHRALRIDTDLPI